MLPPPSDFRSAVAQVADISGKAEHTLEFPVMAVASSSTSAPTPITGHDKQPATVTLLLSPSNHVSASDVSVSQSQTACESEDLPTNLEKLVSECAATAAEEAVMFASYSKDRRGEQTTASHETKERVVQREIVDIMREAAEAAASVAARAAVAAVAGTFVFAFTFTSQEHFSKNWPADIPVCPTRVLCYCCRRFSSRTPSRDAGSWSR